MNLKDLKKIAALCRKAGIKHYKCAEYEFTLTDSEPVVSKKRQKVSESANDMSTFQSDGLTEQDLLFWSSQAPLPEGAESEIPA